VPRGGRWEKLATRYNIRDLGGGELGEPEPGEMEKKPAWDKGRRHLSWRRLALPIWNLASAVKGGGRKHGGEVSEGLEDQKD